MRLARYDMLVFTPSNQRSRLTSIAIAFGYFETLIHYGDANRFLEEETRLRSSSNVLNMAGFDPMLYEDFADETFDLLRKVAQATQAGNAEAVLLEAFNDDTLQNFIMTHLKVCNGFVLWC